MNRSAFVANGTEESKPKFEWKECTFTRWEGINCEQTDEFDFFIVIQRMMNQPFLSPTVDFPSPPI